MSEEVKPLKAQLPRECSTPPLVAASPTDLVRAAYEFLLNLRQILAADRPPEISEALAEQRRTIQLLKALSIFIDQAWIEPRSEAWHATRYLFDHSFTTSSAFSCRLAAIEAIHRCKKLCLIRSLPIKSGEVQTDWIVMGASDRAMFVPSSYRRAVTPLCEVLHGLR